MPGIGLGSHIPRTVLMYNAVSVVVFHFDAYGSPSRSLMFLFSGRGYWQELIEYRPTFNWAYVPVSGPIWTYSLLSISSQPRSPKYLWRSGAGRCIGAAYPWVSAAVAGWALLMDRSWTSFFIYRRLSRLLARCLVFR